MWEAYAAATGRQARWSAWAFGGPSMPELADELAKLVVSGPKRATAGLLAEYERDGDPLPEVDEHSVVLDGSGRPACIIRATQVELKRLGDVDEKFAWDEGEGDRTLAWWREAHIRFFRGEGWDIDDDSTMVLTRFEKVWPVGD